MPCLQIIKKLSKRMYVYIAHFMSRVHVHACESGNMWEICTTTGEVTTEVIHHRSTTKPHNYIYKYNYKNRMC